MPSALLFPYFVSISLSFYLVIFRIVFDRCRVDPLRKNNDSSMERKDSVENLILSSDFDHLDNFDLILNEIGNKNARAILSEINSGYDTSTLIATRTGITIQDVILHLGKLETIGLIVRSGSDFSALRGRAPNRYRISKIAILLIPSKISDRALIRNSIIKKSLEIVKKRFLISMTISIMWILSLIGLSLHLYDIPLMTSNVPPPVSDLTRVVRFIGATSVFLRNLSLPLMILAILSIPPLFYFLGKQFLNYRRLSKSLK